MILSNKQKAVAALVITVVLGVLTVLSVYSGFDEGTKQLLVLAISIVTAIGTPLGVYATTNKPTGDTGADEVGNPDLTTVDAVPAAAPASEVTATPTVTTGE